MTILSFETSHSVASVALMTDKGVFETKIISDKKHEETVMVAAASLLEQHEIEMNDLDMVAVDIGPGSFTGIRIGICHANAIADAVNIPCIGVSALEAIAHDHFSEYPIAVSIDAGNNNCYGAVLDHESKYIYGPVAESKPDFLAHAMEHFGAKIVEDSLPILPSASIIAKIAFERNYTAEIKHQRAMPLYLRLSQAERKRMNQ